MNNDELQKAIDDITKDNNVALDEAQANGAMTESEQLVNEMTQSAAAAESTPDVAPAPDFGNPPAPAVPDAPGMPPVGTPEIIHEASPAALPETPEAPEAPEVPEIEIEPIAKEPEAAAPAAESGSDNDTLNEALKELYPLLDKVDMPAMEKFDITLKFGTPAEALDLAKSIPDDTEKANALLEIVNKLK